MSWCWRAMSSDSTRRRRSRGPEEDEEKEEEEDRSDRRLALFGAFLCLNPSAAQSAVCAGWSSACRRALPSLSLRNAGGWKASYVSSSWRFRTAVLTGDWRFLALSCALTLQRLSLQSVRPGVACLGGRCRALVCSKPAVGRRVTSLHVSALALVF